ncbi:MAG: alpha/beta fold hydrolase [Candidatus Aenigmarchaeota archaeon]|nr:alpha/beta fold hydrolase [Candidatus Aenigmarchaeota archaeon]
MKEIPVTFKNQGQKIKGILHIPNRKTKSAIIIAHGFTGYKREVQIVNCARKLCEEGFAVLRFDFRGTGGSDGLFRNMTISGEVSDLEKAISFVKNVGYRKIGLVGHSLGGSVVILVEKKDIAAICLWAPTITPKRIFTKLFGKKIGKVESSGRAPMSWEGKGIEFIMGKPLWNEVKNNFPDLTNNLSDIDIPKTVVCGSKDWEIFYQGIHRVLKDPTNNIKIIKGGDHTFSKYEHEKQLIDYTVNWFKTWLK